MNFVILVVICLLHYYYYFHLLANLTKTNKQQQQQNPNIYEFTIDQGKTQRNRHFGGRKRTHNTVMHSWYKC